MSVTDDLADSLDSMDDIADEADVFAAVVVAHRIPAPEAWPLRLDALAHKLAGIAADLRAAT